MNTEQDTYHRVPVLEEQKSSSFSDRTSSTATDANRLDRLTYWMKFDHRVSELDENWPRETYHRVPVLEEQKSSSFSDRTSVTATHANRLDRLTYSMKFDHRVSVRRDMSLKLDDFCSSSTGTRWYVSICEFSSSSDTRWSNFIEYVNASSRHLMVWKLPPMSGRCNSMIFGHRVPGLDDVCLAQFSSSTDTRWSNFIEYVSLSSLLACVAVTDVRSLKLDDFCSSSTGTRWCVLVSFHRVPILDGHISSSYPVRSISLSRLLAYVAAADV